MSGFLKMTLILSVFPPWLEIIPTLIVERRRLHGRAGITPAWLFDAKLSELFVKCVAVDA